MDKIEQIIPQEERNEDFTSLCRDTINDFESS